MTERARHHRVRRIALRVGAILLLGAIVNVAVAWGCAAFVNVFSTPVEIAFRLYAKSSWEVGRYQSFGSDRVLSARARVEIPFPEDAEELSGRDPTALVPTWSRLVETFDFQRAQVESELLWEDARGWPMLSMRCGAVTIEKTRNHTVVTATGVEFESTPWSGPGRGTFGKARVLPIHPIWPGFAINTVFYAAIFWLLFAAPGRVRRWRRSKHGLCPKCAYPQGTNEVCTECGASLLRRSMGLPPPATPAEAQRNDA